MNTKKIFSTLFFLGITIISIIYYLKHREDFYLIMTISLEAVIVLSCIAIMITLCYGLQLKILLGHYNLRVKFLECFELSRAGSFANLWLPIGGGASIKAMYLKKFHNLKYSSFIASMGVANIIRFVVNTFFAMLILGFTGHRTDKLLFAIAGVIFAGTLSFLFLGHNVKKYKMLSFGHLGSIIDEWQSIRKDYQTMIKLSYLSTVTFIITSASIYASFRAFSSDISIFTSATIAAFTMITGMLNLVPGNLGIREAIIIAIAGTHGIGMNEGVHAAALGRLVLIIWTLFFAPFSLYNLSNKKLEH